VHQRAEERRRQRVEVGARLAHDVARDELGVSSNMWMKPCNSRSTSFAVLRRARLAVQEDRDVGVAPADLGDELPELVDRLAVAVALGEFLVVDRQDEPGCAALLLGETRDVAETGHASTSTLSASMALASARCRARWRSRNGSPRR